MKPKRRYLSTGEKVKVISRQNGRCACGCREKLEVGSIQYDHAFPIHLGGTNDMENFRALITKHHLKKTKKEAKVRAKIRRIKETGGLKRKKLSVKDKAIARVLASPCKPLV